MATATPDGVAETNMQHGRRASDAPDPRTPRWLTIAGTVVTIVIGLLAVAAAAKSSADATYVRADSFAVQQARVAGEHRADSLILDSRLTRIEDHVARSDSNSAEALRILRGRQ